MYNAVYPYFSVHPFYDLHKPCYQYSNRKQTDSTVVTEVQQLLCFSVALVRHCNSDSCNNV